MRKTILLFIALCLSVSSWAFFATTIGNFNYVSLSDVAPYTAEVTGMADNTYSGSLTIPSYVSNSGKSYAVIRTYGNGFGNSVTKLTAITLPSTMTTIGSSTFSYNASIKHVYFDYCTSLTTIETYAFKNNTAILDIDLSPTAITAFESDIFLGCTALKTVTLPSKITDMSYNVFKGCTALTTIRIPASVSSIGSATFYNCTGLTSIYACGNTPVNLTYATDVFYNVNKTTCILHVPVGKKGLYAAADKWKDFTNIVDDIPAGVDNATDASFKARIENGKAVISGLPVGETINIYNVQGTVVYSGTTDAETASVNLPARGVYIVKVGNESVKVVY